MCHGLLATGTAQLAAGKHGLLQLRSLEADREQNPQPMTACYQWKAPRRPLSKRGDSLDLGHHDAGSSFSVHLDPGQRLRLGNKKDVVCSIRCDHAAHRQRREVIGGPFTGDTQKQVGMGVTCSAWSAMQHGTRSRQQVTVCAQELY